MRDAGDSEPNARGHDLLLRANALTVANPERERDAFSGADAWAILAAAVICARFAQSEATRAARARGLGRKRLRLLADRVVRRG